MKVVCLLVCLAACSMAAPDPSSIQDIHLTPEAEKLLEELVEIAGDHDPDDSDRTRRTSNFLDHKKFSIGSISSFNHQEKYDKYHDIDYKAFNLWGLKKAIFLSLLQAIKAITGGVIAVKGHLIKGGGKILEASGKIVEHKGAAVSDLGKHIAYKALAKPIHLPELSGYGPTHHTGYGAPPVYGPPPSEHHHYYHPTGPTGYEYPVPHLHAKSGQATASAQPSEPKDKKELPDGVQAGLIVLKPMKSEGGAGPGDTAAPSALHKDQGFYKFTSSGLKDDGFYKFDPIGDYSETNPVSHIQQEPVPFFSQAAPTTYYDKPSISRSIEYSYFLPHY